MMGAGSSAGVSRVLVTSAVAFNMAGSALHNFSAAFQSCEKSDDHLPSTDCV